MTTPAETTDAVQVRVSSSKSVGGAQAESEDLDTLTSRAWQLCTLDASVFATSFLYELLPTPVSGLLCCAIEGIESAKNRGLVYSRQSLLHPFNIPFVLDLCWTGGPWVLFLLFLFTEPEDLKSDVVAIPFLMLFWRACCVGVKYAYFSRMDISRLRSNSEWRASMYNFRVLGTGQQFDTLGTICYDWLEELFNSALLSGTLQDAAKCSASLSPAAAHMVWTDVQSMLGSIDDPSAVKRRSLFPGASSLARRGRYVDVQEKLGLTNLNKIEGEVSQGRIPVTALAYYLISKSYRATPKPIFFVTAVLGLGCGFAYPAAAVLGGESAFGESSEARIFLAIRVWVMALAFMPSTMFCTFPVLDAFKRMQLTKALLTVCGDPLQRSQTRLEDPLFKIKLSLGSAENMKAMWVLCQLLGPMYARGQSLRYGSAIQSFSIAFVVFATAVMYYYLHIMEHRFFIGVAAEILVFFLGAVCSIVVTTTICTKVNSYYRRFHQLLGRASTAFALGDGQDKSSRDEVLSMAEWIDRSLQLHFEHYPVMIAFQPASTAVLSLVWSVSSVLVGAWLVVFEEASVLWQAS